MELTEEEKKIIRVIQDDLPLVPQPYKQIAEDIGIPEEVFLSKLQELSQRKIIRRIGAALRHQTIGFRANAMVVWCVPDEKLEATVNQMISIEQISHCYEREIKKEWPYNLYTMIHGQSNEECEEIIHNIATTNGIQKYEVLYSLKELKKSSMKYL